MTQTTINYGRVTNGAEVGSGYDVTVKRIDGMTTMVNTMPANGEFDYLAIVCVDEDTDLQRLAREIGGCPFDGIEYTESNDNGWSELAERWNAL